MGSKEHSGQAAVSGNNVASALQMIAVMCDFNMQHPCVPLLLLPNKTPALSIAGTTALLLCRLLELYDKAPREFKDCIECLDYYT